MLKFGTTDEIKILQVIIDVNDNMSWMATSIKYGLSIYFIKKIYKHFNEFEKEEDIRAELKNINLNNNIIKIYKYNRTGNYKRHSEYYRTYMRARRLKERLQKAKKFIDDHTDPIIEIILPNKNINDNDLEKPNLE